MTLRRPIITAAAILLAALPIGNLAAQEFIFRFKSGVIEKRGGTPDNNGEPANESPADPLVLQAPTFGTTRVGNALSVIGQPSAAGGTAPYTWSKITGPGWLSVSSGGILSGPAMDVGNHPITLQVEDKLGQKENIGGTADVVGTLTVDSNAPAGGYVTRKGVEFISNAPITKNLIGSMTWSATPALPSWLILEPSSGILKGTPPSDTTISGIYLSVLDSFDNQSAISSPISIKVLPDPILIVADSTSITRVSQAPRLQPKATGGKAPFTWAKVSGPFWLNIVSVDQTTGKLVGTATAPGTYPYEIQASDAAGQTEIFRGDLEVVPLLVATSNEPSGTNTYQVTATEAFTTLQPSVQNSLGTVTWRLATAADGWSNPLPPGLTLASVNQSTGVISGTATASGTYNVRLIVTDSADNATTTLDLKFVVSDPLTNLLAWGANLYRQVWETGAVSSSNTPRPITGPDKFGSIDSMFSHTCGINTAGELKCWGKNDKGQIGNGTTTTGYVTPPHTVGTGYVEVVTGLYHTCARRASGAVSCWGDNTEGQIGIGSLGGTVNSPTDVGAAEYTQITAGPYGTCGVTTSGAVKCWGKTNGTMSPASTTPSVVLGSGYKQVTGNNTICALSTSGVPACWGPGYGNNPVVQSFGGFDKISGGSNYVCGMSAGVAKCFGNNAGGQLGNGNNTNSTTPVNVLGGPYVSVDAGNYYACGVTSAGGVNCWGGATGNLGNWSLGNGTTKVASSTPVAAVPGGSGIKWVVLGNNYAIAGK